MKALGWVLFGLLAVTAAGCSTSTKSSSKGSDPSAPTAPSNPIDVSPADTDSAADDPCSEMFSNLFVDVDSISYDGYEVVRLHKTIHDKESDADIPVSYAVLKFNGKTLATFEGTYFGAGNETDFGFASLLGGEAKQLVVSQAIPRNGRQWIVDLSAGARTVFDGKDWQVGGEDVCLHDFDGDGAIELSFAIGTFCGIGNMSMNECPMPGVVFKYEPSAKKYLPNKELSFARELNGIEDDVKKIDPSETPGALTGPYLAQRLDVLLRYVYGGRERDGWAFFDRSYNLPDKKEIESQIRAKLQQEPVYRFVYGKK